MNVLVPPLSDDCSSVPDRVPMPLDWVLEVSGALAGLAATVGHHVTSQQMRWLTSMGYVNLVAGLIIFFMCGQCPINVKNFDRIQAGMTKADVEEILGGPPCDYTKGRGQPFMCHGGWRPTMWVGHDIGINIYYDSAGKVASKYKYEVWVRSPTLLEFFRDLVPW